MHRAINYGLYGAMQAHRGNGIWIVTENFSHLVEKECLVMELWTSHWTCLGYCYYTRVQQYMVFGHAVVVINLVLHLAADIENDISFLYCQRTW